MCCGVPRDGVCRLGPLMVVPSATTLGDVGGLEQLHLGLILSQDLGSAPRILPLSKALEIMFACFNISSHSPLLVEIFVHINAHIKVKTKNKTAKKVIYTRCDFDLII